MVLLFLLFPARAGLWYCYCSPNRKVGTYVRLVVTCQKSVQDTSQGSKKPLDGAYIRQARYIARILRGIVLLFQARPGLLYCDLRYGMICEKSVLLKSDAHNPSGVRNTV